jgi:hypothetical protein
MNIFGIFPGGIKGNACVFLKRELDYFGVRKPLLSFGRWLLIATSAKKCSAKQTSDKGCFSAKTIQKRLGCSDHGKVLMCLSQGNST